ncbi:MAG: hypothetical protein J0M29_20960 [Chitinophagales bacterium]|nr:hypothetical protein [Chitinophagales bacterium]
MKNVFLSLLLLVSLFAQPIAAQTATWRHLGDTLLSSWNTTTVLTALNAQTPHMAIQSFNNLGEAYWSIRQWNGAEWISLDTAGLGQLNYSALGFTNAGTPQLAYFDGVSGKFGIKRLQNGLWSTLSESPVITTTGLYPISMVFENNKLWVGFTHPDQNNRAFVWHFDGNSWLPLGQGGILMTKPASLFSFLKTLNKTSGACLLCVLMAQTGNLWAIGALFPTIGRLP